jgi:hypothetical protein
MHKIASCTSGNVIEGGRNQCIAQNKPETSTALWKRLAWVFTMQNFSPRLGMVAYVCNPSYWDTEIGKIMVPGQAKS